MCLEGDRRTAADGCPTECRGRGSNGPRGRKSIAPDAAQSERAVSWGMKFRHTGLQSLEKLNYETVGKRAVRVAPIFFFKTSVTTDIYTLSLHDAVSRV